MTDFNGHDKQIFTAGYNNSGSSSRDIIQLKLSLKHWKSLHAVISCGSFFNAAEQLNVTPSAVSYTIAQLENQLGMPLLSLNGRKASLTSHGHALLTRVSNLLAEACAVERYIEDVRRHARRDINLIVDSNFPFDLNAFVQQESFIKIEPKKLNLMQGTPASIADALQDGTADLAITNVRYGAYRSEQIMCIEWVAVASADHAVFEEDLAHHDNATHVDMPEVVYCTKPRQRSSTAQGKHARLQVADMDAAIRVVSAGEGYAWVPRCKVQCLLDSGLLRTLTASAPAPAHSTFYLVKGHTPLQTSEIVRLGRALRALPSTQA